MIVKVHRVWIVEEVGPSFQGCRPDVEILEQFETKEEAENYKKKYEQKMEGKYWMGTLHIYSKDTDILE